MSEQKVFTIVISKPTSGKNTITADTDGQLCLEVTPLQQYLSKGWYVRKIKMSRPTSGGNVIAVIVLDSGTN